MLRLSTLFAFAPWVSVVTATSVLDAKNEWHFTSWPDKQLSVKQLLFRGQSLYLIVQRDGELFALSRAAEEAVATEADQGTRSVPLGRLSLLSVDADSQGRLLIATSDAKGTATVSQRNEHGRIDAEWRLPALLRLEAIFFGLQSEPWALTTDGEWRSLQSHAASRVGFDPEPGGLIFDSRDGAAVAVEGATGAAHGWFDGRASLVHLQSPEIAAARKRYGKDNEEYRAKGARTRSRVIALACLGDGGTLIIVPTAWRMEDGMPINVFGPLGELRASARIRWPWRSDRQVYPTAMQASERSLFVADQYGTVYRYDLSEIGGGF